MNLPLLIFDLDGTLVDSVADIGAAANHMLGQLGLAQLDEPAVRRCVGNGTALLIEQLLGPGHSGLYKQGLKLFLSYYGTHLLDHTTLYPGVASFLNRQGGRKKAVISNKQQLLTQRILDGLQIGHHFDLVLGGDSLEEKKPSPAPILQVLTQLGIEVEGALMIGDSRVDMEAGRRAGVKCCGVTYGFGSREELVAAGADFVIGDLGELEALLEDPCSPRPFPGLPHSVDVEGKW